MNKGVTPKNTKGPKNKAYPKYKPSGVEWLGDVPEHWEVKRLSFIFKIKKNIAGMDGIAVLSITQKGIKIKDIESNDGQLSMDYSKYQLVEVADFAMNHMDLLTGFVDVAKSSGVTSPDYRVFNLRNRQLFKPEYYLHILQLCYFQKLFYHLGQGVSGFGRWRLPREQFNNFILPAPPLPEQQAIAAFLDRKTGRIDALIEKKQRLLELLAEQRTALISRAVTRGLDATVKLKPSGVEWLGDVPEHWGVFPLRRVVLSVKTGGTPTGAEDSAFDDDGFNWYSPSDFSDAIVLGKSNRALSEDGKREVRIFPPKTVMLVGIGATIGKVGVAMSESSCNQQINGIVCGNPLHPEFATYYLKTMREFIVKCGKYTTLPIINQDETKNLIFTLPPISEQQTIATFLDHEMAKIDTLSAKVVTVIERLKEYRTALISSAVTGKIDVRGSV